MIHPKSQPKYYIAAQYFQHAVSRDYLLNSVNWNWYHCRVVFQVCVISALKDPFTSPRRNLNWTASLMWRGLELCLLPSGLKSRRKATGRLTGRAVDDGTATTERERERERDWTTNLTTSGWTCRCEPSRRPARGSRDRGRSPAARQPGW